MATVMDKDFPSESNLDFVDELCLSALLEQDEKEALPLVSDAKYAEELQFQEAVMGSIIISNMKNSSQAPSSMTMVIEPSPDDPMVMGIVKEVGESSLSFCEICAERKQNDQMFRSEGCVHSFCSDCITKHVATKVQDSICVVTCPGLDCKAELQLDTCRAVLSKGVIDLWEEALCGALISASQRFYCPFKDCSAMLINDNEGAAIRESECPACHRLFCAQCYVPWHPGVECEEFQRLNEDERGRDDLMVMQIAKDKKWSRCPHCKFFVERTEGCPHITCRCKFQFCYGCGSEWTQSHGGCRGN